MCCAVFVAKLLEGILLGVGEIIGQRFVNTFDYREEQSVEDLPTQLEEEGIRCRDVACGLCATSGVILITLIVIWALVSYGFYNGVQ